jgi:bifunctional DNA-binding transcriptional regulator/antitoxin component of YhaV-PrlF toxin-antitoxin module
LKQSYEDLFSFTAVLDDRGRILIPASIRKRLKIDFGSLVIAKIIPTSVKSKRRWDFAEFTQKE